MKSQLKQRKPRRVGLPPAEDAHAFTRLELAAVFAALGLLALLALPALASQRERSARVLCVNNLRLVGQALQQWGTEHGGRLPLRTPASELGTMGHPLANNPWFQWSWISNELRTPKILACPSDAQKLAARTWSLDLNGGFLNANYRNKAVSYLIGCDVFPESPDGLVAGDRNVRFNGGLGICSSGLTGVPALTTDPVGSLGIGGGLHVEAGNYLFTDGRVEELSSEAFVARWQTTELNDNGVAHYLVP